MPFILDNSIVIGWYFEAQVTPYTEAVLGTMRHETAYVPPLWTLEFSNVLRKAIAARKLTREVAEGFIAAATELDIRLDPVTASPGKILQLALRFNLTSYDAAYLELAIRKQLPIAAKDGALRDAAETTGVGVFAP